jgi:hypothetical protein
VLVQPSPKEAELRQDRLDKAGAISAAGRQPYATTYPISHTAKAINTKSVLSSSSSSSSSSPATISHSAKAINTKSVPAAGDEDGDMMMIIMTKWFIKAGAITAAGRQPYVTTYPISHSAKAINTK